ncbi:ATP-dependent RNA helicase HrpA [Amnibacterium sp.]|uniref:ATP-dependent RNA helicase HrpA n=1 Tax=Amnibacterium sp. TaxID=1872496 RepID=UPI0026343A39|nr:ATP-dependent RNA helicase HrpA [Amnibacterium sp.]MCU1472315.1 ATP-dependent helicase [Amnibacterium sp.]
MSLAVPVVTYPPELPVSRMRDEIAAVIAASPVVVVAGETGSGKTTQLPKICLELGRRTIAHTQPRRIAARTIAERIAEELETPLGGLVGYSVRFTDRSGPDTRVRLMTDGVLLAEIRRDRDLSRYDTIILDEAHERTLNIDFLIGYLKQLLARRSDLKVIITSATIEVERFAAHFAAPDGTPAPIVEVSGRTYPVEVRYRPLVVEDAGDEDVDGDGHASEDRDLAQGVSEALDELERDISGDVLVFLSGESEIRDVADVLRGKYAGRPRPVEILPLYGRLSAAEQHRVFEPSATSGVARRIVLATNVAETSLTVPGIRAVIDGGTARISRYSVRAKVQRLPIEAISQASANQRSGRSGRTSDGIAVRLYSEDDFARRPEYTDPEILRTNLAAVILQMISLGLDDIAAFPFLTPPDPRGIKAGLELLTELGAVRGDRGPQASLTRIGNDLARLSVDPRFGRMLLEARRHDVVREVTVIVAGLTIQDPRERPVERREQADAAHARFADPTSDLIGLLNLWNHLERVQAESSSSAFRRRCKAEFLNFVRIREWQDLVRQLSSQLDDLGGRRREPLREPRRKPAPREGDAVNADLVHKSVLAGLLSQIGVRDDRTVAPPTRGGRPSPRRGSVEFLGARQLRFSVFPGSALAKRPPAAIMSAELVETSRLFARMNAAVDPAWAEPIAGDLVKRTVGDPRWEQRQGAAVADERVTLFGVPIVEKRRIQYARVDPVHARDLLLEHAFLEGEWPRETARDRAYDFDRANRRLRREIDDEAERTRRPPVDEQRVIEFYDARIPAEVHSVREFEAWWRDAKEQTPDLLDMVRADLVEEEDAPDVDPREFPPFWRQGEQRLKLRYRFAPGAADDGVTVQVPLPLLAGLSPAGFDWQVPGLRQDLVAALLKTLPKPQRRFVVPTGDWARRLLPELPPGPETGGVPGPLVDALALVVRRVAGANPAPADFEADRLPPHLRMAFEVLDNPPAGRAGGPSGRAMARDVDLVALQRRFAEQARASVAKAVAAPTPARQAIERRGLTTFDLDELPGVLDTRQSGGVVRAYPALVDTGSAVDVRLLATREEQTAAMRLGIRRLLLLATPSPAHYVREHLSGAEKLALAASPYGSTDALFADCLVAVVEAAQAAGTEDGTVWTRAGFERLRDRLAASVLDDLFAVVGATAAALAGARDADAAIRRSTSLPLLPALTDARGQLDALIHPGFVSIDGAARLPRLAVYTAGMVRRVERLPEQANRDRVWMTEVATATDLYRAAGGVLPLTRDVPEPLVRVRWLLEELRLSLFAQGLPTSEPVSLQRIRRALA